MALSNARGSMVLATGNKSEMSVGYSTLYGDMVGGFAPLRDLSKTWCTVREPHQRRRRPRGDPVATSSGHPPPSCARAARYRQSAPYDVLDGILEGLSRTGATPTSSRTGARSGLVARVIRMVDRAEFKRRQGPVGIKISAVLRSRRRCRSRADMCDPRRFRDTVHRVGRALVVGGIVLGCRRRGCRRPLKVPPTRPARPARSRSPEQALPPRCCHLRGGARPAESRFVGRPRRDPPGRPRGGVWRLIPRRGDIAVRGRAARARCRGPEWALVRTIAQSPPAPGPPTAPVEIAEPLDPSTRSACSGACVPDAAARGAPPSRRSARGRASRSSTAVSTAHTRMARARPPLVARAMSSTAPPTPATGASPPRHPRRGTAAAPINGVGIVGVAPSGPGAGEVIPVRIASPDGHSTDQT